MPLPDFIIGGAPKCGTTALFHYLDQHPEIYTSTPKEPHFFARKAGDKEVKGKKLTREEYENLFEEKHPNQTAGEGSTGYLNHAEKAAPQISKIIPDVKLIFLLRNPVERDYSGYWYNLRRGEVPLRRTFSELVYSGDHWIFHGSNAYLKGLETFFEKFREEQVLVLLTDELRENSEAVVRRVCNHIGVDPGFSFNLEARHNVTKYPRSVRLCRWIGRTFPGLSRWASDTKWIRGLRSRLLFSGGADKPPMQEHARQKLADHYKDEIEKLEMLIDRDLSHWI
ncbi:sulfotransferase family protein [Salinibacter ruber]|uniref:sulfotransferase family protein n=1 Tax=Salinibacter ruber TaxID=146919 RepID=UPI000E5737C5|nr:sulfotransferase [Salinibacter ruber]